MLTTKLPSSKSGDQVEITFVRGDSKVGHMLSIFAGKRKDVYGVVEFQNAWAGRSFHFAKWCVGTDREEDGYDVFCGLRGEKSCSCKGFTRHGRCKHANAALAILANGWMDCPVNLDSDVSNTEAPF